MNNGQVTLSNSVTTQLTNIGLTVVTLKAHPGNTNLIWIGDEDTTPTTGFPLASGEIITVAVDGNLNVLYGIANTDGEKVCWIETSR